MVLVEEATALLHRGELGGALQDQRWATVGPALNVFDDTATVPVPSGLGSRCDQLVVVIVGYSEFDDDDGLHEEVVTVSLSGAVLQEDGGDAARLADAPVVEVRYTFGWTDTNYAKLLTLSKKAAGGVVNHGWPEPGVVFALSDSSRAGMCVAHPAANVS